MRKILLKNKTVLCLFFEKSFHYFPCEVFLISSLESWINLLLNLEIKLLLILESSWFLLMKFEIYLDLELVGWILKSFFGLFVIIFVIIKTTWINLIHHHEACFYTLHSYKYQVPSNSQHIQHTPAHGQHAYAYLFIAHSSLHSSIYLLYLLTHILTWTSESFVL